MKQSDAVLAVRKIFGERADIEWGEWWIAADDTVLIRCVVQVSKTERIMKSGSAFNVNSWVTPGDLRQMLVEALQSAKDDIVDSLSMHPVGTT